MAKGSSKKGAPSKKGVDANEVAAFVLQMAGKETLVESESTKEEAAAELWKLALATSSARVELAKTDYADVASKLLDHGTLEEQHVCAGLLAAMAADQNVSESILKNSVSTRIVNAMNRIFVSDSGHDRSKITAAELLFHMAGHRAALMKLSAVVPASLALLSTHGPLWSNIAVAHASIAGALLRLIQSALVPASRIRHPDLLEAVISPMAEPTGIATLLDALSHGSTTLTAKAAGCMYWVAVKRGGKVAVLETAVARKLLALALISEPERQAYILGILAEAAVSDSVKTIIGADGGCTTLTRILRASLFTSRGRPVPLNSLPPFVAMVVDHGAALAYQLSFLDAFKRALLTAGAAPLLVGLLKSKNPNVHANCTGALFHMGLEPDGGTRMEASAAPRYLLPPVPVTWLASENCPTNLPRGPRGAAAGGGLPHDYDPTWDKPLHQLAEEAA